MFTTYEVAIDKIEMLNKLLQKHNINPQNYYHYEHDYLSARILVDDFYSNKLSRSSYNFRSSLVGLLDIANWLLKVQNHQHFGKLIKHIKLLENASPTLNKKTDSYDKRKNKYDDKSDKIIELVIGAACLSFAEDIDLDDPVNSSGGKNPDIIFTHGKNRISFACKKLHSVQKQSILDNIKKAAEQIIASDCNFGYVLLNMQNVINHPELDDQHIYKSLDEPLQIAFPASFGSVKVALNEGVSFLEKVFSKTKVKPAIILYGHTTAFLESFIGFMPTSLKVFNTIEYTQFGQLDNYDKYISLNINDFVQTYFWETCIQI